MSKYGNPENDARLVLTKSAQGVGPEKRSYSQRQFTDEKPTYRYQSRTNALNHSVSKCKANGNKLLPLRVYYYEVIERREAP
jgi:hypothetical protein